MKRLIWTILLILTIPACQLYPRPTTPLHAAPEAASPLPAEPSPQPDPTSALYTQKPTFNIRYSEQKAADPRHLSLDVYPSGSSNSPVMVYVHGGSWRYGTKSNVDSKPEAFKQHGFVFVSVNYRLIPEVSMKEQVNDVATAIAWVKNNISEYGGDPRRIFIMGHSAGAHLVSLVATDSRYLESNGMQLNDIRGVISLDTQAYDIVKLMAETTERLESTYTSAFTENPKLWEFFSPSTYVAAGKSIPPFFLVYSGQTPDRGELAAAFANLLEEAGIHQEVHPALDKTHGEVNEFFGLSSDPVSEAAFQWLENLLDQ